jgi:hypothetical protein
MVKLQAAQNLSKYQDETWRWKNKKVKPREIKEGDLVLRRVPRGKMKGKMNSHRYTGDHNSTHFKRNNPLVCRVTARYNHGSIGSKQVYLAWRWVYNHATAHQLLVHRISKHYYKLFQM